MTQKNDVRNALLNWTEGPGNAERLAAGILHLEGFANIDPTHPFGGPDRKKDAVCHKDNHKWMCAVYFPPKKQTFNKIRKKLEQDLKGVTVNKADGIVFLTNQQLTVKQRETLKTHVENTGKTKLELYHLDCLEVILNKPEAFGLRLRFLEITVTKEEILSYTEIRDQKFSQLANLMKELFDKAEKKNMSLQELREYRDILTTLTGPHDPFMMLLSTPPINKLNISSSLQELKEFQKILTQITGHYDPYSLTTMLLFNPPIKKLDIFYELKQLKEYEATLERIIEKQNKLRPTK